MTSAKPQLLLHVCCGPCATAVIERLIRHYRVTAFWHNPNVHPTHEHDRRLEQVHLVTREFDVDLVVGGRDEAAWLEAVAGQEAEPEGGARCPACFEHRLSETAREAARRGIGLIATTLTVSPHKRAEEINAIGRRVAGELGVEFVAADFKQDGGFQRSVELSKELGLYRQRYCGCRFSRPDGPPLPEDQTSG